MLKTFPSMTILLCCVIRLPRSFYIIPTFMLFIFCFYSNFLFCLKNNCCLSTPQVCSLVPWGVYRGGGQSAMPPSPLWWPSLLLRKLSYCIHRLVDFTCELLTAHYNIPVNVCIFCEKMQWFGDMFAQILRNWDSTRNSTCFLYPLMTRTNTKLLHKPLFLCCCHKLRQK